MNNILELVKNRFETSKYFDNSNGDAVIPINYTLHPESKIMFVVGSNASGKSVVGKIIEGTAKKSDITARSCSMRNRTSGLFGQMLIFGTEDDNSTGQNSVKAVLLGIKSTISEQCSVLILDEPDLGLADDYSFALGQYIAQQVNEHHQTIGLIVVISHSRRLINAALDELNQPCSKVYVGNVDVSLDDWLNNPIVPATVDDLLNLENKSLETWRKIEGIMKDTRK